jgi:hypothetical protein
MSGAQWLGVLLLVAGLAGLAFERFSYKETKEVVDIGPVEVNQTETHTIPIPTIAGVVAVLAGVGLLLFGRRAA